MLIYSEKFEQTPVLSLQTGAPLAELGEAIIDPRQLAITAFYCHGEQLDEQPAVLHTSDIREFSDIGAIVDGSDAIMSPESLVRLQEIIGFNFTLVGMKVIDNHRSKLGKVLTYVVNTDTFMIEKLTVKRPLLHSLNDSELIVDRSQIVEITGDSIIVRAPSVEETRPVTNTKPIINPFRNSGVQPEGR